MSTTAQSAEKWLKDSSPSDTQVEEMIHKLESRIDNWQGDDEGIQGSIEAVDALSAHLQAKHQSTPEASNANFDASALIPDNQPVELAEDIKLETFAALKAQLDKRSD
ncbi:hypothetical protein KO489_14520 [Reinekea forsetii]|nr:hypothetical protein [Reinekea forsetii]